MIGVFLTILVFYTTCIWAYFTRKYYSSMSLDVWKAKHGNKTPKELNVLVVMVILTLIGFAYTAIYLLLR